MRGIGAVLALFVLVLTLSGHESSAQIPLLKARPAGEPDEEVSRPLVDTNRKLSRDLERAKERLASDDYSAAIEFLQERILDRGEDYFVDQEMKGTIKAEALRLIEAFTPEQRRHYDLRYGVPAQQLFEKALERGDLTGLAEVSRRYFHTEAGYEATYRLGAFHLDQSRPVEAALCFERLRRYPQVARRWEPLLSLKTAICWNLAGLNDRSEEALKSARDASRADRLSVGGRNVRWFAEGDDPEKWLAQAFGLNPQRAETAAQQWRMARGDAAHNASAAAVSPLWLPRWSQSTLMRLDAPDPKQIDDVTANLRKTTDLLKSSSFLMFPAAQPLCLTDVSLADSRPPVAAPDAPPDKVPAADQRTADVVVFRTLANIRAVHLHSGKTLWETTAIDPHYEKLIEGEKFSDAAPVNGQLPSSQRFLKQRAFQDATVGTLTTDGQFVFSIEEAGYLDVFSPFGFRAFPQQAQTAPDYNRLMAIELSTGRLAWEVGGPPDKAALPLGGTFFLGAPVPVGGQLFAIGENGGDIRLYALDPANGAELWSQNLVAPDSSLETYPQRRMTGLHPAYAEGVLVCSTASRGVIAVDLARRELLWGKKYNSTVPAPQQGLVAARIAMQNRGQLGSLSDDESRWLDALPLIVDGRVILTPRDSDEMFCLRLTDGKELWRRPRGQGLFVAGIHEGNVVVVGRTQIEAFSLTETEPLAGSETQAPKPAWREPTPVQPPSGRGLRCGRFYHLPLSTGEIATLDLVSGRIVARSKTGSPVGNLVAAGGTLVSQTVDSVIGLRSLDTVQQDIAARLEKNADDATALALRGELRLHQGQEAEALGDLRKAVAADKQSRAKDSLTASFLEGLRLDFATWRPLAPELEPLITEPVQRAQYLRLIAAGLHSTGDRKAAFAEYLKLASNGATTPGLEQLSPSLSVRGDRWVRARLNSLLGEASESERPEMERSLREMLAAIGGETKPGNADRAAEARKLRTFLGAFGSLPAAEGARRSLAGLLDPKKEPLELELVLRRLRASSDPAIAGNATARLISMQLDVERSEGLAELVRDLEGRFADVQCLDGKTGKELAETWKDDDLILQALAGRGLWPDRQLQAKATDRRTGMVQQDIPIEFSGSPGLFDGWCLSADQRRQSLSARDSTGETRWSIPVTSLRDPRRADRQRPPQVFGNSAKAHGHLVVITLGNYFAVLDTLAQGATPKVLWTADLVDLPTDLSNPLAMQLLNIMPAPAPSRDILDGQQRPMGTVGVVADEFVAYQSGNSLYCADALTGEILWERKDMLRGSRIFGNREFLFVVPIGSQQLSVYRASDGELAGTRMIAPESERLSVEGGLITFSSNKPDGTELSVFDSAKGEIRWKRGFAASTRFAVAKHEEVAALDPSGRVTILSIAEGKPLLQADVGAVKGVETVALVRSAERYLLMTNRTRPVRQLQQFYGWGGVPVVVDGPLFAFDRLTGKLAWKAELSQLLYDPSEPEDVPVVVFAAIRNSFFLPAQPAKLHALRVIDGRNGHTLHEYEGPSQQCYPYRVVGDMAKKQITVETPSFHVEMNFTEAPAPPANVP